MPFNGSGGFDPLPAPTYPAVSGEVIFASRFNAVMQDVFDGLGQCVTRDGQSPATADVPMGGFDLTGVGAVDVGLGLVATPSYTFTGDTNTGMWSPAADTIAWSLGGAEALRLDSNGLTLASGRFLAPNGTAALPGYGFVTDADSGIYLIANNRIGVSIGSSTPVEINATGIGVGGIAAAASYQVDVSGTVRSIGGETGSGYGFRVLNATQNGGGALTAGAGVNGGVALTADAGSVTIGSRFVFLNDGRMYGSDLHNNAGSVSGAATQFIASGTYTPTGTGVNNITTLTPRKAQWIRVGNVVTVSGLVTVDPTGGALCSFRLSLPIASNFATGYECAGMARETNTFSGFMIYGDGANNEAYFTTNALTDNGLQDYSYTYQYEVLA